MALVKTAVAVVLACSFAQAQFPADVVSITIEADRDTARPGEALTITATSSIDAGWHIYSSDIKGLGPMPSHFEFVDNAGIRAVGPIMEPEPERIWDEGFEMEVGWHSGKVSLSRQVLLSDGLSPGTTEITGVFVYMACTDAMCLPPAEEKFALPIRIEEGEARPAYTFTGTVPPAMAAASGLEGTELQEAIQEGFWAFIMLAVGMGFLALLTPCVFPMIPITVSFFLKQGEDNSMPPLKSAGLYAVGIIVIYSALGLLLALTLGAAGANRMAADPWINLILGALFIYFALSLFGMYEIQLPSALRQFSASQETRGGLLGIFFMAFTFTITSFTCTVQFVGLLLVAASQGHYLWPFIGMVTYAATFALPFFLLALFPQKLAQLPKSGSWLNSVKVVMGFLEFAAAFKFISNSDLVWSWGIFDHQVVLAAWTIILLLTGLYLLGKLQLPHDSPVERTSVPRLLLSGSFLILALLLGAGLTGQKVPGLIEAYLPPRLSGDDAGVVLENRLEEYHWFTDYEAALAEARMVNRPVFLDVTGYTCTNCRWMEANIFTISEVEDRFEQFVLLRLYTDAGDNYRENQAFAVERFGTVALPFYTVLAPDGEELARLPQMTRDMQKFISFLDEGLDGYHKGIFNAP